MSSRMFWSITVLWGLGTFAIAAPQTIHFSHQLHVVEQELECSTCHEGIETAVNLKKSYLPTQETCSDCHDVEDETNCGQCHVDPRKPQTWQRSLSDLVQTFPHERHISAGQQCLNCHREVVEDKVPTTWLKETCRQCHQRQPKPDFHNVAWKQLHGTARGQYDCTICHQSRDCDQCHLSQPFNPQVHPRDYVLGHGQEAAAGVTDCGTCHQDLSTCRSCHRQRNIMPFTHSQVNWALDEGGGLHVDEALSAPATCLACHQPGNDLTCKRCHTTP